MNVSVVFKNLEPSEHLKKYARRRMEKMARFFGRGANLEVAVTLTVDKFRQKCDVTLTGEGLHLNAGEQSDNMYAAIDLVSDKLESQVKKKVSRVKEQRRKAREKDIDVFTYTMEGEVDEPEVVGTQLFATKPLYVDEALMQLEAIEREFLVFLNAETNRINVVYYRKNKKGFGLIDPVL